MTVDVDDSGPQHRAEAGPGSVAGPPRPPTGPGVTAGVTLTWIGHATVLVELDDARLLVDPVLRGNVGPLRSFAPTAGPMAVDAALVSHVHRDHLDLPSLRLLPPTRVVAPRRAARWLGRRHQVTELTPGEQVDVSGVTVTAVPARHATRRNRVGRLVEAVGYVVEGSRSVYVAGDTALFPGMARLGERGLDLAVLPVGGWGLTRGRDHLDARDAALALRLLRPRAAVPVHWGTLRIPLAWRLRPELTLRPGPEFAEAARLVAPEVHVRVLAPGDRVTFAG